MKPRDAASAPPPGAKVLGVSELTRRIKATLEGAFGQLWVEGELSNLRRPSSGHCYFTLKDANAQLSAVLFRGDQRGLDFELRDGLLVRVFGQVTVYERGGNYQVIVRRILESGKGALQARFEALKEKLLEEGLFDEERKQELPTLPRHIGVVTSPTGAAIRDILNVLTRRFPNLHLVLAPARVQGEAAAAEIAAAVDLLNRRGGLDVMIVGRGGGSLEDLWCFNEEVVARAIARSTIPVISAVGHEIDFTISDFTADVRAPTPSAAAEIVVGRKEAFEESLDLARERIGRALRQGLVESRHRLAGVSQSYVFREPANLVRHFTQRLDALELRMGHRMETSVDTGRRRLQELHRRETQALERGRERYGETLKRLGGQLQALNPLRVLERGYSMTCGEDGRAIRSVRAVRAGQRVRTRVADGTFDSEVAPGPGGPT